MGCYDAGHGALVPWAQSLAMAQLASTSQAAAFREGKRDGTSQQRGSHCTLLAVLGVVASLMVSHWLLGLLWGLAENNERIWPWAPWNGLFLFCCPLVSWLWVIGSAFSLLWVSLQLALQSSSLSASCWRMLSLHSLLFWSDLWWWGRCSTEMVKSIWVSLKSYSLSKSVQVSLGFPLPCTDCLVEWDASTLLVVPGTVKDKCPQ